MSEFKLTSNQVMALQASEECVNTAVEAALTALIWSEDVPDDSIWSPQLYFEVTQEVSDFMLTASHIIRELDLTFEEVGHNLYLSANGHGTGFWDRGWGEKGQALHEYAKAYPKGLYVGDDGLLYGV